MEDVVEAVGLLFEDYKGVAAERIEKLPQSGSDRVYYRIYCNGKSYIGTCNHNISENETFINFTQHFIKKELPVPAILAVNDDKNIYLQEDLGTESLLDVLEKEGMKEHVFNLYKQSLKQLARVQIIGDDDFNYENCLTAKEFGKQAILNDLLYFKYYFLDTLKLAYDKQAMLNDFDTLCSYLSNPNHKHFMFRDFQSRNIIVKDDKVHFIDYQGGMKGAIQYDVASLLWQAKANLSEEWKSELLEYYIAEVEELLKLTINKKVFISRYNGYVLIRLLQVLGAYGFRGLFERKAHFLNSIPQALNNLQYFLESKKIDIVTPEFSRVLRVMTGEKILRRFEPIRADDSTPLVVKICSFSYKKIIPVDESDNGGGFMFDMRGILNPGRYEEYKCLTGRDKEVKDFLEQRTKITDYLNSVCNIVDITVEDYIKRGFSSLMVSFGCTGGQHRSVYAADALARHLKNKFGVKIQLCHVVQDAKNWINTPPVTVTTLG